MKTKFLTVIALTLVVQLHVKVQAATITVTSTADHGAGTLRNALASVANGDTINFSVTGSITLTTGELVVSNSVDILGPGPASLALKGNFPTSSNRVFHITNAVTAVISGLTITNGHTRPIIFPAGAGAGIWNDASTLTLSNCVLARNVSSGSCGGILNDGGAILTVNNCIFKNNMSALGYGSGAIFNTGFGSVATVIASTFTGNNSATDNGAGGGNGGAIFSHAGTLTVIATTISGNSALHFGGGILCGTANITETGTVTLIACTLVGNSATINGGGGINNQGLTGIAMLNIGDTMLNNAGSASNIVNFGSITSLGYNLSSDNGAGALTNTADQINTDPMLGPLQDNGGPTFTHALLPGSPAIDKGKSFGLATDQRGQPRVFDDPDIANASGGDGTDIGAYEAINLRITAVQKSGNHLQLSFTTGAGGKYVVESRSDLLTGAWAPLPGTNTGTGVIVQLVETNALTVPEQFYRIHQLP